MKTLIMVLLGICLGVVVIGGVFSLLGAILGVTFGIIGTVVGWVFKVLFTPAVLIVIIVFLAYKLSKRNK